MADKIVVLSAGRIEQVGSPLELYHRPRNQFVAGFIGSPKMNFIPVDATAREGGAEIRLPGGAALPIGGGVNAVGAATLGVRPEHLRLGEAGDARLNARVKLCERLGAETMLYADLDGGQEITVSADGLCKVQPGERIQIALDVASCHLFDRGGATLVNGSLL